MAALLLSVLALAATANPAPGPARFAAANASASVRILTPALVGAGYGAPLPGMEPHALRVALPDGSSNLVTVYEFE